MKNHIKRLFVFIMAVCVASCAAVTANAAEGDYPPAQLSAADTQILKDAYADIRAEFENTYLPHFVLDERSAGLANGILAQDTGILEWVHFLWAGWVSEIIFNIQKESETTYQLPNREAFSELTSDELSELMMEYIPLVQEVGMSSYDQFDVSFAELTGNGVLILLAFKKTDNRGECKYLGIAAEEDGSRHFYFAQPSAASEAFPEMAGKFFCGELIPDGESNYWNSEANEAAFIESIHAALKGELEYLPMLNIVIPKT